MAEETAAQALESKFSDFAFGSEEEQADERQVQPEQEGQEFEGERVQSAEEREAASEDEEVQESAGSVEDEEAVIEIEIDGELLEVPEKYKDYFLRQQDYTKKTQEVAEQRKAVEVALESVNQQKAQYEFAQKVQPIMQEIQVLSGQIDQANQYIRDNLDSLSSTEIEKIRFGIDDAKSQIADKQQSIQGETQEFQQAQEQSFQELLKKGTEVLQQRIPNWGEESQKQVRDYALENGFSEAEVNSLVDPRHVEVLYKAAQYDALKSGAKPAIKTLKQAPKVKSRNPMPEATKQKLNLRKKLKSQNLSNSQKAGLIGDSVADRFFK